MVKYRKLSNAQKRDVVQQAINGDVSKSSVCRKYNISYTLLAKWVKAYENGRLDNEPTTEAGKLEKIEKLEQMIGRQVMEIEFLKKALARNIEHSKKKERLSKSINSLSTQQDGGAN